MDIRKFKWIRQPEQFEIGEDKITITTMPHTDLWQRTYYHFRNDNAPVLQMETEEAYFSFIVKTNFEDSHQRFDQCGIVMYLDSESWLFRLGHNGDPGGCEIHVVPAEPPRG